MVICFLACRMTLKIMLMLQTRVFRLPFILDLNSWYCFRMISSFLKFAWLEHWYKFISFSVCKRGLQFWTNAPKVAAHACAFCCRSLPLWSLQSLFGFSSSTCKEKKEAASYPQPSPEMSFLCYPQPSLEISCLCECADWKKYMVVLVSSFLQFVSATLCNVYITSNEVQAWSSICVWDCHILCGVFQFAMRSVDSFCIWLLGLSQFPSLHWLHHTETSYLIVVFYCNQTVFANIEWMLLPFSACREGGELIIVLHLCLRTEWCKGRQVSLYNSISVASWSNLLTWFWILDSALVLALTNEIFANVDGWG
jgi:hypothetical protein